MREGMRNNGVRFFHPDGDGSLWIGTTSGISRWNGSRFRNYYVEDGLAYGSVRAIAEDVNGDILIGTDRGINRVRNGKFVPDAAFAQLGATRCGQYIETSEIRSGWARGAAAWFGCGEGQVKRVTTQEGLLSDSIFQVLGANDERLWISGPVGISFGVARRFERCRRR